MKIRLVILIFLALLVIFATFFTIFHYRHSLTNQYDEYIIRHSLMRDNPELKPVDPAIVKALISVRTNFTARISGNDGEVGLMYIPLDGTERFKDFHGEKDFVLTDTENKKDYALVCPNRMFSNHPNHNELFTRTARRLCPVCNSRLIEALFDPEINIRVGTWYLGYINSYLHENIDGITDEQAFDFSIVIFSNGLNVILADIENQLENKLKEKMKETAGTVPEDVVLHYLKSYMEMVLRSENIMRQVRTIKKQAEKYRPGLVKKARILGISLPAEFQ